MENSSGQRWHKFDNSPAFKRWVCKEVETKSREGRKKLSVVPLGLNKEERLVPSVKTLGYFRFEANIMRLAPKSSS